MSYLRKIEYEIVLRGSFWIVRGCPKCGRKTYFQNTKKFRINANGNKLDIWLIYHCEECKHTLNLSIYERQKVSSIPKGEYQCFLDNDEQLAEMYGKSLQLFQKNKVTIDFEKVTYDFVKLQETTEHSDSGEQVIIAIKNPYQLKVRPEKQIAEILGMSRSQVKNLLEKGILEVKTEQPQFISVSVNAGKFSETDRLFSEI